MLHGNGAIELLLCGGAARDRKTDLTKPFLIRTHNTLGYQCAQR
jgi:hypothetical protein